MKVLKSLLGIGGIEATTFLSITSLESLEIILKLVSQIIIAVVTIYSLLKSKQDGKS